MKLSSINTILFFVLLFCAITYKPYMLSNAVVQWKQVFREISVLSVSDSTSITTEFSTLDSLFYVCPDLSLIAKPDPQWLHRIDNANDSVKIRIGGWGRDVNSHGSSDIRGEPILSFSGPLFSKMIYGNAIAEVTAQGIKYTTSLYPEIKGYPDKVKLMEIDKKQYKRLVNSIDYTCYFASKASRLCARRKPDNCRYKNLWIEIEKNGNKRREWVVDSGIDQRILLELFGLVGAAQNVDKDFGHQRRVHIEQRVEETNVFFGCEPIPIGLRCY